MGGGFSSIKVLNPSESVVAVNAVNLTESIISKKSSFWGRDFLDQVLEEGKSILNVGSIIPYKIWIAYKEKVSQLLGHEASAPCLQFQFDHLPAAPAATLTPHNGL